MKMVRAYQGLRSWNHQSPQKSKCCSRRFESRSHLSQLVVDRILFKLCKEFDKLNLRIIANIKAMETDVDSTPLQDIRKGQLEDKKI
jgi:hypothetical protein